MKAMDDGYMMSSWVSSLVSETVSSRWIFGSFMAAGTFFVTLISWRRCSGIGGLNTGFSISNASLG
jgi:hypothetical protein